MDKRIVITGMATINPLGDTLDGYIDNLLAGKSGVRVWKSLDLSKVENKVGGDLGDYDWAKSLETFKDILGEDFKAIKKLFKFATFSSRLSMLTAMNAWRDAGLYEAGARKGEDPYRTMTVVGGHNLNSNYIAAIRDTFQVEPEHIPPLASVEAIDNNVPALITEVLKLHGPAYIIGGACASGNLALRDAMRDIRLGEIDRAIVCGAVFDVSNTDIQASCIINSVVVKPELQADPSQASRPFDVKRNGFVYSHGSATLIVESLESALARGARIHAEVLGVKASANGCHLPMPGATHQAYAMRGAIQMAGIDVSEIDYANCHATGTPAGDIEELTAVKEVLGQHAYKIKFNAPKSMLGHTCWASPLVETIGGILQMQRGRLHPTINISQQAPEVDVDICANKAVDTKARTMLKNSFGFGGLNCVSVIRTWSGK